MKPELDPLIHQPVRLRIMAALSGLTAKERLDFVFLRDQLNLTDGNLGQHLQKLEEAGYVCIEKEFVARKPRTSLSLTPTGRSALQIHLTALRTLLDEIPLASPVQPVPHPAAG